MHMADALVSPAVGGALWAASGGLIAACARRVKRSPRESLAPLMGVLGAFVFAAQMINFSIPGTGSSGHLGGGLLLAILLGPHAALLVIASVLTVQAFFFADGGLLALGCNIFNLGFLPAFVAYPLVYRPIATGRPATSPRALSGAAAAAAAGLLLGAFGVVIETQASGISELPFRTFVLMMVPIHLAIGLVEGVVTAAVVSFIGSARPEVLPPGPACAVAGGRRSLLAATLAVALVLACFGSWFASTHPDGLEWSIARVSGRDELPHGESRVHQELAVIQQTTAVLPDYGFRAPGGPAGARPSPRVGTSTSGLVGGVVVLALASLSGLLLRGRRRDGGRGGAT